MVGSFWDKLLRAKLISRQWTNMISQSRKPFHFLVNRLSLRAAFLIVAGFLEKENLSISFPWAGL